MATVYLNLTEFADRLDIARDTLAKYKLPPHDAMIGDRRGWLESTIDAWQEARPGRGNWGPNANPATGPRETIGTFAKMNDGIPGTRDVPTGMFPTWDDTEQDHADRLFEGPKFSG